MAHELSECCQTPLPNPMAFEGSQNSKENIEVQTDGLLQQENNHTSRIDQEITPTDLKTVSDEALDSNPSGQDFLKDCETALTPTEFSQSDDTGPDVDVDANLQNPKADPVLIASAVIDGYSDVSSCSEPENEETLKCDQIGETHNTQSTKDTRHLDLPSDGKNGMALKPCESAILGCEMEKQKEEKKEESLLEDQYSNISSPELDGEKCILKEEQDHPKQNLCTASDGVSDHSLDTQNACAVNDVHEVITDAETTPSKFQSIDGNVDSNMSILTTDSSPKSTDEVLHKTTIPTLQENTTSQSPQTETVRSGIDNGFKTGEDDGHFNSGLEMEHSSFEFLENCLKNSEKDLKSSFTSLKTSENTYLPICGNPNQTLPEQNEAKRPPRQNEQGALDSVADSMMLDKYTGEPQSILEAQNDKTELSEAITKREKDMRVSESSLNVNKNHDFAKVVPMIQSHNMKKKLDPVVVLDYKEQNDSQVGIYRCAQCSGTAETVDHLIEHHYLHHSKLYFQLCQNCGRYFTSCQLAGNHSCEQNELEMPLVSPKTLQHQSSDDSQKLTEKAKILHKCSYCPLRFSKWEAFQIHEQRHKAKMPFKCQQCGSCYSNGSALKKHQRLKKCIPLGTVSEQLESKDIPQPVKTLMKTSVKTSHGTLRDCFVKLVDIYKRDPVSPTRTCKTCNKSFKLRAQYNTHMRTHSSEKPYKCKDCSKAFKYSWNLNRHRKEQCGRIPNIVEPSAGSSEVYKQEQDPENSTRKTNDSALGTVASRYKCPLCPRLFKYSYNLSRHLRLQCLKEYTKIGGKGKTASGYKCPLCGTSFTIVSNLSRHLRKTCLPQYKVKEMYKIKPETKSDSLKGRSKPKVSVNKKLSPSGAYYKCKLCPAVFSHSSGLFKHLRKHRLSAKTGKPVRYRTANPDDLKPPSYSEEKGLDTKKGGPLSCQFCGKRFTELLSLKKHMTLHKADKPYSCQQCGKHFKKYAYLIAHNQCHKKKVQCSVCQKIFPTIAHLLEHRQSHNNKGMLKCPDCPMEFRFPVYLFRHLVTHERKRQQKEANQAKKARPQPSEEPPEKHKSPIASKEQFSCSICQTSFVDAKALGEHCLSHLPKASSSKCQFCKRHFSSRPALIRHIRLHTGEKPFPCKKCGKYFHRKEAAKAHMDQCKGTMMVTKECNAKKTVKTEQKEEKGKEKIVLHKVKKQFKCSHCPHSFVWPSSLTKHLNGHKLKQLSPCPKCGRCYKKTILDSHERTCNGKESSTVPLFPCNKCGKSFSRVDNRRVHERKCEVTTQKPSLIKKSSQDIGTILKEQLPHKCPHCPKSFKYRSYLLKHLPSHLAEKPYTCMHCGHKYSSQRRYLQHEAFCDGVFRRKSTPLREVMKTESVDNTAEEIAKTETDSQYRCKFCNKNFSKARNLRRHILTHTDVKPYRCKTCDSCFSRYDHLKVHQSRCKGKKQRLEVRVPKISSKLVGTGWQSSSQAKRDQVFQCKVCSKQFSRQINLARHTSLVHTFNKPFVCKRCGSSFSCTSSLKKHTLMVKCKRVLSSTVAKTVNTKVTESQCRETAKLLQRIQGHYSDKFKFQCAYCPRRFKDRGQLQIHTRLHTGEKPFGCENCGERFIRRDYLQRHLVKCTSKKEPPQRALCDRCGQLFPEDVLQSHKLNCAVSGKELRSKTQAKPSPPSKIKAFSCTSCSEKFLLFSQLQQHFLSMHREDTLQKPYDVAEDVFIKQEPLDEEQNETLCSDNVDNQNDNQKPFICPHCNMRFVNTSGLGMHIRTHTAEYPLSCRKCDKGFWSKNVQLRHQKKCKGTVENSLNPATTVTSEPESEEKSAVLVFNKGSNTTGTGVLQTKFSCKDGNKNLLRNVEQSSFPGSPSDKEKMATNKYQCSECDQSFTDGLKLISHLENHGREDFLKGKQYCNICGKGFDKPRALSRHMSTQHGTKTPSNKNTCQICLKSFRFPSDLDAHKSCHDPSRPFACSSCDFRFLSPKALRIHVSQSHHKDESYTCHPCNKTYLTRKSYVRHNRLKHGKGFATNTDHDKGDGSSTDQFDIEVNIDEESDTSDVKDENEASEDDSDSAPYFPCHVCGKTFSTSESLEDHQRCHLGEKPHECEECGKCFFQLVNLQQHQRSHKSEFQCQTCGRGFVSLFALRKHKHSHGKSRPHRCSKCHLSFTGPSQLAEHMATHRDENFPCDLCDRTFSCKISRAEHRKIHNEEEEELPPLIPPSTVPPLTSPPSASSSSPSSGEQSGRFKYRCGVCSMRFRDPEQLSEHGCKAAKERPYSCPECDKHFLHGSHLKKHQLSHQLSGPYRYQCNQCHMNFTYRHHFLSHLRRHGNEKESGDAVDDRDGLPAESKNPDNIYQCPICPQSYSQAMELADHLTIHSFMCKVCNVTFSTKAQLTDHEQCHLTATTQYECTECGKSFLGSDAFRQHQCAQRQRLYTENGMAPRLSSSSSLKHSSRSSRADEEEEEEVDVGEDFCICSFCKKRFSSQADLEEHRKLHPECRPYKCQICGKGFAKRRYLNKHQLIHERPFRCEVCPQSFDTESALLAHQGVHNTNREFQCSVCQKFYTTAQDLFRHEKKHAPQQDPTTGGTHRCDMCYKSFGHLSLLRKHQETHVGEVVYECTECDKAFAFFHLLEEHQRTHVLAPTSTSSPS